MQQADTQVERPPAVPEGAREREQPPLPQGRLARAILRDLRHEGPRFVVHKSLGALVRAHQLRRYRFNMRYLTRSVERVKIDRPLFILGVMGGGITILARCFYRHPRAVYASGNSDSWAGPDEIQNCTHIHDLPEPLTHRSYAFRNVDGRLDFHPRFGYQRSWLYASDEFLPQFRKVAADADPRTAADFRRVLQKLLLTYAHDPDDCRFVDMSHLYTVQVPYIARLLDGCRPFFVLAARNPYATCQRAVQKEFLPIRGGFVQDDRETCIKYAVEHWSNSFRLALEAAGEVPLLSIRYEDFLADPERVVRRICDFAELEFDPRQVPGPGQPYPLGGFEDGKWHPLRNENTSYLDDVDPRLVRQLNQRAGDVIEALGYERLPG